MPMKKLFLLYIFTLVFLSIYAQEKNSFSYTQSNVIHVPKMSVVNLSNTDERFNISINSWEKETPNRFQFLDSVKKQLEQERIKRTTQKSYEQYNKTNSVPPKDSLLNNFLGNSLFGGTPNDNHLAISNNGTIVSVVNTNIRVYRENGSLLLFKTLSFFGSSLDTLNRTFDPRVIYDPIEDKFILLFLNGSNSSKTNLIIGFSQTNDPTGKWNLYKLEGNVRKDTTWSDYPMVGISKDELFVTINLWNDHETCWDCDPTDAIIWQINKSNGFYGDSALSSKYYGQIKINNKLVWNFCPIIGGSAPYGPNMYFLATRNIGAKNDSVFLIEISNTLASKQASITTQVCKSNLPYGIQPHAKQPDGRYLRTNFCDVQSGFYENGIIQYVGNSIDTATFSPGVFYGRISNLQTTPTLTAKILGFDTLDINYPSIAYAGGSKFDNSAIINFLHVSPKTYAGTSSVYVDGSGNFSSVLRVKSGFNSLTMLYPDSVERWGDYTGIQRKYNEQGICWLAGSFALLNGDLSTWIAKVKSNDLQLGIQSPLIVENSFSIYPNPSDEFVILDFTNTSSSIFTFTITDIVGKKIKQTENIRMAEGKNSIKINISSLKAGVYFLEISNGKEILTTKKFVISNH